MRPGNAGRATRNWETFLTMPNSPDVVEPEQDYLGFICEKCGEAFSIIGPLDPAGLPPRDEPMKIGAQGPLPAECTHCGHKADYTVQQLVRFCR
jgi:hypothetical protein